MGSRTHQLLVFLSEPVPAGGRNLQLLQRPDGAPAEAERRADRLRQPSDGGEERPEEPLAETGGGAPALPAGGVWLGLQREFTETFGESSSGQKPEPVLDPTQSSRRGAEPVGSMLSQEREAWSQEKIRLEKALLLAQSQISRLRGEIRSNAVREITGPEADNAALKV